jgi:hypothetical protein
LLRIVDEPRSESRVRAHAHALGEKAGACLAPVIGHETRVQQHVAVDEDEVVRGGGGNGEVAQACEAETFMRLRDDTHRHRRTAREGPDQVTRGGTRAVVGDDDFIRCRTLPRHAVEYRGQRIGTFVRTDDQRGAH